MDCQTLDFKFSSTVLHPQCFYYCSGEADDRQFGFEIPNSFIVNVPVSALFLF